MVSSCLFYLHILSSVFLIREHPHWWYLRKTNGRCNCQFRVLADRLPTQKCNGDFALN